MAMVSVRLLGQCATGLAVGRTMGSAMAGALVAVPAGRVAGVASMMLAVVSLGSVVTFAWSLPARLLPSSLLAECYEMVGAAACITLMSLCQAPIRGWE